MLMLDYCVKEKRYDINEIFENILYVQLLFTGAVIASKMFPKKVGHFFSIHQQLIYPLASFKAKNTKYFFTVFVTA